MDEPHVESTHDAPRSRIRPARTCVEVAARTHIGRRDVNADALAIDEAAGFYAVADGMGDTPRSSLVAQMALGAVREMFADPWTRSRGSHPSTEEAERRLVLGVVQAHGRIYAPWLPRAMRMGSTFAGVVDCGDLLVVGHVGNARAYVLRAAAREMLPLTIDHTVAGNACRRGVPAAIAATLPWAHCVTQMIGRKVGALETSVFRWDAGDMALLCTDGVSDPLDDESITAILLDAPDLGIAAQRLVDGAVGRGGSDNATALLLHRMS